LLFYRPGAALQRLTPPAIHFLEKAIDIAAASPHRPIRLAPFGSGAVIFFLFALAQEAANYVNQDKENRD
jgi:hypothetical protein